MISRDTANLSNWRLSVAVPPPVAATDAVPATTYFTDFNSIDDSGLLPVMAIDGVSIEGALALGTPIYLGDLQGRYVLGTVEEVTDGFAMARPNWSSLRTSLLSFGDTTPFIIESSR